jgi:hypothetical protein
MMKVGGGPCCHGVGDLWLDRRVDIGQPCMMPALNVPNLDGGSVGISRKH